MTDLVLRNRQRTRPVNLPLLRRLTGVLLRDLLSLEHYQLGIHLVAAPEIARVNQRYLNHEGTTDVISFNYGGEEGDISREAETESLPQRGVPLRQRPAAAAGAVKRAPAQPPDALHGEIFICIDEAGRQARQFRVAWQSELVRYLVHGVLHLVGYDDLTSAGRRVMKREENRLLRMLSRQFALKRLAHARSSRKS
jgi:probable rRNA maturation factor